MFIEKDNCNHLNILECTECPLRVCQDCNEYFMSLGALYWWPTVVNTMTCKGHPSILWQHPFSGETIVEQRIRLQGI